MKRLLTLAVLAAAGCATAGKSAPVPVTSSSMCLPCTMPCTPDSCNPPKVVAKAEKATPAPTPPPPAPKPEPAAAATFSPQPGTFDASQQIALSSTTPGAVIHYTTDGSTPTESSPVYAGPIAVDKTTTVNAIAMAPGLPASEVASGTFTVTPPPKVVVTKQKLELKEKVLFATGKGTIDPQSYALLDEAAQAMKDHPEVKRVRVEGHTDSKGSAAVNKRLSKARANAVMKYLVEKGVEPERLVAQGYGPSRPIASNRTAQGRDANRRVELTILEPKPQS